MAEPTQDARWTELRAQLVRYVTARVSSPADVDDIVQEALLRVHGGLAGLEDETRLGAWLARIAQRAIADHYRRASALTRRHEAAYRDPAIQGPADAPNAASEVLAACLVPFIDQLEEPYRSALQLTEVEGLSQREAAERVGVSVSGFKSRVQRGRRMLRGEVETCCAVELDARNRVVDFTPRQAPSCCQD